jgi:predicted Ser/Thr protein kinase/tetratricopeptide (TPR) repeat protein
MPEPPEDRPVTTPNDPTMSHDSLDAVIAGYMLAVEAGDVPHRQELLDQHPEHAESLHAFFADLDRMDRVASPLRMAGGLDATGDVGPNGHATLPTVRYFGDYELLEEIARGGMGIVYKARQTSLNRLVALKMILAGSFASSRDVQRFRTEAESAANLDHPHIVPIYEVGEHEGQQYFSMKFIEGTSLAGRPRGEIRIEVAGLVDVARAVHHAHQRGILHRDLKPSNVMVDPRGTRLVTDFGLAKRLADSNNSFTETGQVLGTPKYMAPEQAAGRKDLTVAADVYSLGVILYERLTGQTPFMGDNALTLLRQARESEPPRPSSIRAGLDKDLETVILKCLEKEPGGRYASAEALADDLENWFTGHSITARPVGQAERVWRWCKRNPAVATSLAAAVVAVVSTVALSIVFAISRTQAAQRLAVAYKTSEENRIEAQTYAASVLCDQGLSFSRRGEAVSGLFRLVRALELAPPTRPDLQLSIRRALAAVTMNFPEAARYFDTDAATCAAFSPDGRMLVTGHDDGKARIWDTATTILLDEIQLFDKREWYNLTFRADGEAFMGTDLQEVRTWCLSTHSPLGPPIRRDNPDAWGYEEFNASVIPRFNSDGTLILIEGGDILRTWVAATGKPLGPPIETSSSTLQCVSSGVFRPDGNAVVVLQNQGHDARLIDTRTGRFLSDPIHSQDGFGHIAFSPDSKTMVTSELNGNLQMRQANDGQPIGQTFVHLPISDVPPRPIFSRDGRMILTGGGRYIHLWDSNSRHIKKTLMLDDIGGDSIRSPVINIIDSNKSINSINDHMTITNYPDQQLFQSDGVAPILFLNRRLLIRDTSSGRSLDGPRTDREFGDLCQLFAFEPTGSNLLLSSTPAFFLNPLLFDLDLWSLDAVKGEPKVVRLWSEVLTRSEMIDGEKPHPLPETPWEARREHLERLLGSAPRSDSLGIAANDRLYWLRCEADLAEQTHRWDDAVRLLTRLTLAQPNQWRYKRRLGDSLGRLGRYREALSAFRQARILSAKGSADETLHCQLGLLLLASGDERAYHAYCKEVKARFETRLVTEVRGSNLALDSRFSILMLFTSGPWPREGWGPDIDAFVSEWIRTSPSWTQSHYSQSDWSHIEMNQSIPQEAEAYRLMRAGRYEAALHILRETEQKQIGLLPFESYRLPFLAILHHRLGNDVEARKYLEQARSWLREVEEKRSYHTTWDGPVGIRWDHVLAVKLVTREAEVLIDTPELPADPFAH